MKLMKLLAWAVIAATLIPVHGSDRTAVYARVDRVVLEPNDDAPEAIHVWGVFSLAKPNDPNEYLPPAKGYMYFRLPSHNTVGRRHGGAGCRPRSDRCHCADGRRDCDRCVVEREHGRALFHPPAVLSTPRRQCRLCRVFERAPGHPAGPLARSPPRPSRPHAA